MTTPGVGTTDELALVTEEGWGLVGLAESMEVVDQPSFEQAGTLLRSIKTHIRRVQDFMKPLKVAADQAKKAILDQEKATLEAPQAAAETLSKALATFEAQQRRESAIAQARAAEEARQIQATLPVGAPPVLIPAVPVDIPKSQGISFRTYYRAEVTNLPELIAAIVMGSPEVRALLAGDFAGTAPMEAVMPDQAFLNKQAGTKEAALKNGGETALYPGVKAIGERKSATRSA